MFCGKKEMSNQLIIIQENMRYKNSSKRMKKIEFKKELHKILSHKEADNSFGKLKIQLKVIIINIDFCFPMTFNTI